MCVVMRATSVLAALCLVLGGREAYGNGGREACGNGGA